MLILVSICLAIFSWMWHELLLIRAGTPVSAGLSYGIASIAAAAAMMSLKISQLWLTVIFIVCILVAHVWRIKFFDFSVESSDAESEYWFFLGACIYVGTFLLSSNWDYRLIFLIMCIPYFVLFKNKLLKYALLGCLFLACSQLLLFNILGYFGLMVNILAKSTLFVLLASMLLSFLENEVPLLKRVLLIFTFVKVNNRNILQ